MITRTMLLALGQESAKNIKKIIDDREAEIVSEATRKVVEIAEEGVTASALMALATVGRDLKQTERACSRLNYFNDNFQFGGVAPEDKPAARRKAQRDASPPPEDEFKLQRETHLW